MKKHGEKEMQMNNINNLLEIFKINKNLKNIITYHYQVKQNFKKFVINLEK